MRNSKTMKLLAILLLLPIMLMAQKKETNVSIPKVDLGIKVGANISQLSGDTWDNGYQAGFLGGAFLGLRGSHWGIQAEAFLSQTSYTVEGHTFYDAYSQFYNNARDSVKNGSFKLTYLSIPVLLQLRIVPMLWLQVGPQYSGIVSVNDVNSLVKDAKGLFTSGAFSGVVGLDLRLPAHLDIGARYLLGLSSLNNTDVSGAWQQKTIQLHVGYNFL